MKSKPSKAEDSCSIDHSVIEMETGFGWFPAAQEDESSDAEDSGVRGKSNPYVETSKDKGAASKDGPNLAVEIADISEPIRKPEFMDPSPSTQTIDKGPGISHGEIEAEKPGPSQASFERRSTRKLESKSPPSARETGQRIRIVDGEKEGTSKSQKRIPTRKHETMELQTTAGNVEQDPETIYEEIGVEVEPRRVQLTSLRAENKKNELKAERRRRIFVIFIAILTCVTLGISLYSFINSLQVMNEAKPEIKNMLKTRAIRKAGMEALEEYMAYFPLLVEDRNARMEYEMDKFTVWFGKFCGISWYGTCFWVIPGWYSYEQAEAICAANGAKFTHLRDRSHYEMTVLYFRSINPEGLWWVDVWLGMKYNTSTGSVVLTNGNPAPYVRWLVNGGFPERGRARSLIAFGVHPDVYYRYHGMANRLPTYRTNTVLCEKGSE